MAAINPHINFNGNAEEAFHFYKSVFGGELLRLVDAARHLHLNSPGSLDRHLFKVGPDRFPKRPAFFDVGEDE